MIAIGCNGKALFAIGRGDLNAEQIAVPTVITDDARAVRQIMRQAIIVINRGMNGSAANKICAAVIFRQRQCRRNKADTTSGAGTGRLVSGQLYQRNRPIKQALVSILASDPVAVDFERQIGRHPFTAVFRAPKANRIGCSVAGLLIGKAARGHRVAVFQNRI